MTDQKQKPGPKPSGKALTNAQRQRNHRARVRVQLEELKALSEKNETRPGMPTPVLPHPSKIDPHED